MISNNIEGVSVEQRNSSAPAKESARVLVVDDHDILHEIIELSLVDWDIDFSFVTDGSEVINCLKGIGGQKVVKCLNILCSECIFLDFVLPNYSGVELSKAIRFYEQERQPGRPAYLIGMTGNMGGREEEVCLDAGMNDFITKPFDPARIQEAFRKFLQSRN